MSDKEESTLNIKLGQDDATSRESGNAGRAPSPFTAVETGDGRQAHA
jgi:hypothetical protein